MVPKTFKIWIITLGFWGSSCNLGETHLGMSGSSKGARAQSGSPETPQAQGEDSQRPSEEGAGLPGYSLGCHVESNEGESGRLCCRLADAQENLYNEFETGAKMDWAAGDESAVVKKRKTPQDQCHARYEYQQNSEVISENRNQLGIRLSLSEPGRDPKQIEASKITPSPSVGEKNKSLCQGTLAASYCWYLGEPAESCEQTCLSKQGSYDKATRTYAGSGGNDKGCQEILKALGVVYDTFDHTPYEEGTGIGCYYRPQENSAGRRDPLFRMTMPTASAEGARRVCACTP
jgi:hypothetical protein